MLAKQPSRAGTHRLDRQGAMVPADPVREQRGAYRPVEQEVGVVAARGGEARVELCADRERPAHGHRLRQKRIRAPHPRRVGPQRVGVEMGDLKRRVYARIGASGCNRVRARARDGSKRGLERILHATAVGLRLPAVKRRAVVFESERDAHASKKTAAHRAAVL